MITIAKPIVEKQNGGGVRMSANVDVDGIKTPLWVEVSEEYGDYLCAERSDAFLLGLLHYALEFGHDIKCLAPVTKRLYEQLTELFIPAFCKVNKIGGGVIVAALAEEVEHFGEEAVATGVSCGVDSMHVFATHPEITHGVVFDLHDGNWRKEASSQEKTWHSLIEQAKRFTGNVGVKLLPITTNYDKGILPGLRYEWQTGFASLFMIFSLQKLFKVYYVASGYSIEDFNLGVSPQGDVAYYESFLFPLTCLSNISVRLEGIALTRLEKIKDIADYEPAQRLLNVCLGVSSDYRNCCSCWKCKRTILELMVCGKLEKFRAVFDLDFIKAHHYDYALAFERGIRAGDSYLKEIYPYLSCKYMGKYKNDWIALTIKEKMKLRWQLGVRDRLHDFKRKFLRNKDLVG